MLSSMAEGAFALLEHPPLITSLTTQGDIVEIYSYVTGVEQPIASWNGENLHIFLITSLAMLLAVPLRSLSERLKLVAKALPLIVAIMLAICIVQLESSMEMYASTSLGMTLHSDHVKTFLDWANRSLIMVGMLLLPAFLFLRSYVSHWTESQDRSAGEGARVRSPHRRPDGRTTLWTIVPAAATCMVALILLLTPRPNPTPEMRLEGLSRILALNPQSAQAHFSIGVHHEREGRLDKALEFYQESLRLDPGLVTARFGMGNVLYAQRQYEQAASYYAQVAERDSAHVSARYNLGNALMETGEAARAAEAYEGALRLDPNHASAHKNLGVALIRLGRECEALGHLQRSAALDRRYFADAAIGGEISRLKTVCGSSGNGTRRTVAPQDTDRAKPASRP